MDISVIICTHNPREAYLRRVLDALKAQTLAKDRWELLLVDNASAKPVAETWELSWHPHARQVREDRLGLTHARLRGIAESRGELLVFVDDDNVLRPDYLAVSRKIAAAHPLLSAWGGSCVAEYETEPPEELRPWLFSVLVIEVLSTPLWARLPQGNHAVPSGAGMVVRRKAADHYRDLVLHDPMRQALDRSGEALGGGGDSDMALCGFDLGFGTGRFPELELTHLIPAQRLTLEYFEGVHEGFGYAGEVLNAIYRKPEHFPEPSRTGPLRLLLLRMFLFIMRKSRVEKRIKLARERGRMRGQRDVQCSGYFNRPPAQRADVAS